METSLRIIVLHSSFTNNFCSAETDSLQNCHEYYPCLIYDFEIIFLRFISIKAAIYWIELILLLKTFVLFSGVKHFEAVVHC